MIIINIVGHTVNLKLKSDIYKQKLSCYIVLLIFYWVKLNFWLVCMSCFSREMFNWVYLHVLFICVQVIYWSFECVTMPAVALDRETFLKRLKHLYSLWKVIIMIIFET